MGLHFLSFWPSFPVILALWAFISLHFGLVGLHFLAFWPCGPSFPCVLAFWAFFSLHFGLVGLHFLPFWPSFSCHFGLVGLHFLAFGLVGRHFGLMGLHFLAFWPFRPSFPCTLAFLVASLWGLPPISCQKWSVSQSPVQRIWQRQDRLHFAIFSLLGLQFCSLQRPFFVALQLVGGTRPCLYALLLGSQAWLRRTPPSHGQRRTAPPHHGQAAQCKKKKGAYLWRRAPPRPPGQPPGQQA